ncbi:hypothetical protein ACIBI9_32510 [Nonomuraea sp. NPDC050451]|uniref:hypothetical protein n=1 Tax=Nonomuraea sp. NPDC050451 TaxID=3364364 RepID=UPI00379F3990
MTTLLPRLDAFRFGDREAELGVVIGAEVRHGTGTPGGVGHARRPPRYLREGSQLVTRVEGVGEQRNTMVRGS